VGSDALPLSVAAWLLTYALHSTVLIGGAWLAAVGLARLACRSQRLRDRLPSLREQLWKVALVGGIVTASLQTGLGVDPFGFRFALARGASQVDRSVCEDTNSNGVASSPERTAITVVAAPIEPPTAPRLAEGESTATTGPADAVGVRGPRWLVLASTVPTRGALLGNANSVSGTAPEAAGLSSVRNETTAPPVRDSGALDTRESSSTIWVRALLCVWLVGVALGLGRWICQWNRLLRRLDDREPVRGGQLHEVFQHLLVRSKARASTTLSIAPAIAAPITLGFRRLEICLPPRAALDLQREEIAALLAHELAHAERRDPAWLALCRFVEVVFFFQPLNKVCSTWLEDEAEYLCDDWAIAQIGERIALASCLTEIAGWIVHDREPALAPAMAARGTRLSTRVRRLLDEDHAPSTSIGPGWITVFGSASALGVALLVPGVSAASAPRAPEASEEAIVMRMEALEASFANRDDTPADASAPEGAEPEASRATAGSSGHFSDLFTRITRDLAQSITTAVPAARTSTLPSTLPSARGVHARGVVLLGALAESDRGQGDLSATLGALDLELDALRGALDERGAQNHRGAQNDRDAQSELDAHFARLQDDLRNLHERAAQLEELLRAECDSACESPTDADAQDTLTQPFSTKD
jgi:beta-lactamase regulating signal transducer with metallopeptidase domain